MQLYTDGEPDYLSLLKLIVAEEKYLDAFETLYDSFDELNGENSSFIKRENWSR